MATSEKTEPTRPVPVVVATGGQLKATTKLTPTSCRARARLDVPPSKVIPVIVVPGIMGSNLRMPLKRPKGSVSPLQAGEAAWRPPNGLQESLAQVKLWEARNAATRQKILNGAELEVDPGGAIDLAPSARFAGLTVDEARTRGWGELHWNSYGMLLTTLQLHFSSFLHCTYNQPPTMAMNWIYLNLFDRSRWRASKDGPLMPFSAAQIEALAEYSYPVYAVGYNWLQSNKTSSEKLRHRIEEIIKSWQQAEFDCKQVAIVTHSMGGLVARACAKLAPDLIAGVVHGCMPALGAPVCYRRIACGTEASSPSAGTIANAEMDGFSKIAGPTALETTAVMANSRGALELLPTHLYPRPWIFAAPAGGGVSKVALAIPGDNIYDLYREDTLWYRLIDYSIVDPAGLFREKAKQEVLKNIDAAETFHRKLLQDFYHPNTYTLHGDDQNFLSYGTFAWSAPENFQTTDLLAPSAKYSARYADGSRAVALSAGRTVRVVPSQQDSFGDGTVPKLSGAFPAGRTKGTFATAGYSHQSVFQDESSLALTNQLLARALLEAKRNE